MWRGRKRSVWRRMRKDGARRRMGKVSVVSLTKSVENQLPRGERQRLSHRSITSDGCTWMSRRPPRLRRNGERKREGWEARTETTWRTWRQIEACGVAQTITTYSYEHAHRQKRMYSSATCGQHQWAEWKWEKSKGNKYQMVLHKNKNARVMQTEQNEEAQEQEGRQSIILHFGGNGRSEEHKNNLVQSTRKRRWVSRNEMKCWVVVKERS